MNIIACEKRVPSTTTRVTIEDGTSLDPSGVEFVLNPYDEFAVEVAIQQKEKAGDGNITVYSFGTSASKKELRTTLAMGADQAHLLQNENQNRMR